LEDCFNIDQEKSERFKIFENIIRDRAVFEEARARVFKHFLIGSEGFGYNGSRYAVTDIHRSLRREAPEQRKQNLRLICKGLIIFPTN
jgi:hypothetical protein